MTSSLSVFVVLIYSGTVSTHIFIFLTACLTLDASFINSFASSNVERTASAHPSDVCSAVLVTFHYSKYTIQTQTEMILGTCVGNDGCRYEMIQHHR